MPMTRCITVALVLLWLAPLQAWAQSCNFGISNVNFGSVDVLAGGNVDVTATLNINCTGVALTTIRICPSIGAGSGGADTTSRLMSGPGTLRYQLYQDAARTTVWGSYTWGLPGTPPTIDLALGLGGSGSTTRTIFGRVFGGQSTAPAGSYVSNFTAAQTSFVYAALGVLPCPNLLLPQTANPTFTVNATVVNNCLVTPQNLNFGTQGVLSANIDASSLLSVTCTPGTSYSVGLNGGNAGAAPTARKLAKGGETITYGLYRDAARSQPWGDTIGTNTAAGTGSGIAQDLTVFGRVPPQATPTAGTYTDTIVVTVTF
jgi:spore coat protein U-like protein